MENRGRSGLAAVLVLALAVIQQGGAVSAAGGPAEQASSPYRVLAPIESGNLLVFPVVRDSGRTPGETPFITLDEGFRSGEVEVTEAGNVRGLVRPRGGSAPLDPRYPHPTPPIYENRGDQVNTLVLVNHSRRPLLMLAGEIVTGGKQDRVIAKDRIVPADADPIDLSVFCIEPGRWTGSSPTFGAAGKAPANGFMVQPTVREKAMVARDQQQVWDSVHGAISEMTAASAARAASSQTVSVEAGVLSGGGGIGTTSYAKAMQNSAVAEKVDEAAAPSTKVREQVFEQLRQEHAVGVVVAVRGEIVWADLFASTDLLSRYWVKLVRSYAAESLTGDETHGTATLAEAQHFLDAPLSGTESSEGEVGVYRYRELRNGGTETFVLESLLPGAVYDAHISKMKLKGEERRPRPEPWLR